MRHFIYFLLFFIMLSSICFTQQIDQSIVGNVSNSVLEVVQKRPVEGRLSYDKELPAEFGLDNTLENSYIPIGSAFHIGNGEFISAAHLFVVETENLMGDFFIKDSDGNKYQIESVLKYSDFRDFILFKVDGYSSDAFLELNSDFELNTTAFAVGNALGDGIVIRGGQLTSSTPESVSGRWNWLRFTAAASPGNSGGPLIDSLGNAIGVISMKSLNENLNFALPISEVVNSPENIAVFDKKVKYGVSIFNNYNKIGNFRAKIKLPLTYNEFCVVAKDKFQAWTSTFVAEIKDELKSQDFPQGKGVEELIYGVFDTVFPGIIAQKKDSSWNIFHPELIEESNIGKGGSLKYGKIGDFTIALLKKGDDLDLDRLYSDSAYFMDNFLEGLPYYRDIAGENYRITSLGAADNSYSHTDVYGRKWIVSDWSLDYTNIKFLTYILPVPDGAVILIRAATSDMIKNYFSHNFELISNHLYLTYEGSFKAWSKFLSMDRYLPTIFKDFNFSWSTKRLTNNSNDLFLDGNISNMAWDENSTIKVMMSFQRKNEEVLWIPRDFTYSENRTGGGEFKLTKILSPNEDTPNDFVKKWGLKCRAPSCQRLVKCQSRGWSALRSNKKTHSRLKRILRFGLWAGSG